MKLGPVGYSVMGAGLMISVLCGLAMSAVNARFHLDRKIAAREPFSVIKPICDAAVACAFFAIIRAIASLATLIVLFLRPCVKIPQVVIFALLGVSAGLYIGEVVPAGVSINLGWDAINTSVPPSEWVYVREHTRNQIYKNRDFLSWYARYDWQQRKHYPEDPTQQSIPTEYAEVADVIEGYGVPYASYFRQSGSWGSVGGNAAPCVVDFANSTWPVKNPETNFYDSCDNFTILTIECVGGWNEKNLNAAIADSCRKINASLTNQKAQAEALTATEWLNLWRDSQTPQFSQPDFLGTANCILIVFETVSFLLTAVGLGFQIAFKDSQ